MLMSCWFSMANGASHGQSCLGVRRSAEEIKRGFAAKAVVRRS